MPPRFKTENSAKTGNSFRLVSIALKGILETPLSWLHDEEVRRSLLYKAL